MRKIIFLDIDGVLNFYKCKARVEGTKKILGIDDRCLRNLKYIIDKTNAEIVLSSSWRNLNHEGDCYQYMLKKFNQYGLKIIDQTGRDEYHHRHKEILEYINNLKEPVKYIAIDDEFPIEFRNCGIPYVHTCFDKKGLTKEKARQAIKELNKE